MNEHCVTTQSHIDPDLYKYFTLYMGQKLCF